MVASALNAQLDALMPDINAQLSVLPIGAIHILAGLVAGNARLPVAISNWMFSEIGKKIDITEVSPIAEAAMRLVVYSESSHQKYALEELKLQYALIQAMQREDDLFVAVAFFQKLCDRIEDGLLKSFKASDAVSGLLKGFMLASQSEEKN
jgi:hypothetical protein